VVTNHPASLEPALIARKEEAMRAGTNREERELAHRSSAGIEVTLLWNEQSGELTVTAFDSSTGELFALPARREQALDVFNHPFAYAARERRAATSGWPSSTPGSSPPPPRCSRSSPASR
jgi:hypothetical protein